MKVAIVLISISKNVSPGENQALDCNLKVLLPEALIKLPQVTLKCNRLEAEFT